MSLEVNSFKSPEYWLSRRLSLSEIRSELEQMGLSDDDINQQLSMVKSLKYKKQRQIGFGLLTAGALCCVVSCLLTFFHGYSEVYVTFVLYGMTMVGACLLLAGLALVLGI